MGPGLDAFIHPFQQCPSPGKDNAFLQQIRCQFWRCFFQHPVDTGQDVRQRFFQPGHRILGGQPQAGGQSGNVVPSPDDLGAPAAPPADGTDFQLDFFRQRPVDLDIQPVPEVADQTFVEGFSPIRREAAWMIRPMLMTAALVVPLPMSTTIRPRGSWMGSPAPRAAASGPSIR